MTASVTTDLFFESLVRGYVDLQQNPRFIRRDWLAAQLDERLREPGRHLVLLIAKPGAGKSVFMAQLAFDHPEWPRYFIRRDQRSVLADVSARSLLLRIGYQLASRQPELFSERELTLSVKQRIGEVAEQGEAVGVEVKRLIASPFYQKLKVLVIDQQVEVNRGKAVAFRVEELYVEERQLPAEDLLHLALIDPARALQRIDRRRQVVILVDALDEIRYHPAVENILAWLTNCPALPKNIRFVLTSRPPDEALNLFRTKQVDRLTELTIAEDDDNVTRDTDKFVAKLISEPALARALAAAPGGPAAFATKATARAHGNLGYLDALARGVDQALTRKDTKTLDELLRRQKLPAYQEGLYAFFLQQIKASVARGCIEVRIPESGETCDKAAWPAVYHPILGVLAVAMEPLDLALLTRLAGIQADRVWVSTAIDSLRQFLNVIDGRYRLYHSSVAEFLTANKTRTNLATTSLYQDAAEVHRKIAEHYLRTYTDSWKACPDNYGLDHLVDHLLNADLSQSKLTSELHRTFTTGFIEERGRRSGWHRPLVRDLYQVRSFTPEAVVEPGLRVVLGDFSNSLANQEALRLLVEVRRDLLGQNAWKRHLRTNLQKRTDTILATLELPSGEAVEKLLKYLEPLDSESGKRPSRLEVKLRAIAALALGEIGSAEAIEPLGRWLVDTGKRQVGWAAADALIAMRNQSVVPLLLRAFNQTNVNDWAKHRILYVLGRMPAVLPTDQKRRLIDAGLKLRQDCRLRVVDAIYLLRPDGAEERARWNLHYEAVLCKGLNLEPGETGLTRRHTWTNPGLKKRAVVALGRIGSESAIASLKLFLRNLEAQDRTTRPEDLLAATHRAIAEWRERLRSTSL